MKGVLRLSFLSLMLLILFPQALPFQEEEQTADVLVLKKDQEKYFLGTYLEILRDSSGELTIDDVTSTAYQSQFFTSQVATPNFGYQTVPYWVRFRVQNQTGSGGDWVLVLGFRNMHYMDLYVPDSNNETYSVIESGVLRGQQNPNVSFDKLSFDLEIPPGIEQTFYIRFQNEATMTLPLILMSPEAFARVVMVDELVTGTFYSTLMIMVIYNLILYALIKEKVYLYLVLFSLSAIVFFLFYHATIFRIFPETPPGLSPIILPIVLGFFIMTLIKFVDSYLELKNNHPKIHKIATFATFFSLLTSLVSIFIQYHLIITVQLIIVLIVFPAILVLALYLAWHGYRTALLLLGSVFIFVIGALLSSSARFGLLPSNFFTEDLLRVGLIWMVASWSLALADRMNTLKIETEASKNQIIKNEERLAQYLDSLPVGVLVYDDEAQLQYINQQSQMILNQPSNEENASQITHNEKDMAINSAMSKNLTFEGHHPIEQIPVLQAIQQGTPEYMDHIEIKIGKMIIPVEVWSNPMVDDSGEFNGTVVAFRSIQEKLNQEEQLRQSEEIRHKILEGSRIGTWMNNLVTGEVFWDSRSREIFGVKPNDPASLELGFNLIHADDRERALEAYENVTSPTSNGSYEEEKRIVRPDGQVRWVSTRGNVIYEEQSGSRCATRMVGIVIDVTQQKEAEKELEASKVQYQHLIETMNEGLVIVDGNLILTYVNPRLCKMLGYNLDEIIGSHVNLFVDETNFKIIATQFAKRKMGLEQSYTVTLLRKDGTELHSLITPAVVYDENGEFQHSIGVISDISEQIEIHKLLDMRMQQRTREILSLMKVSRIVVSSLTLKDQLRIILEELKGLVQYDGASVLICEENELITDTFEQKITKKITKKLMQPFMQKDGFDPQFWHGEILILPNIRMPSQQKHEFVRLTESLFRSVPIKMVAWIGIPIKSRNTMIGVLSAFAAQEDFFNPEIRELMQAFANQIAIIFENNRLFTQAQLVATATERDRLGRELHDSVTQSLYSVRLYAEAVRSAIQANKLQTAEKNLEQLTNIAKDGMSNLRLLIFELRPPVLEELGLVDALKKRLEMVENRAGIQTDFSISGDPDLSPDIETQLYWVVYEALSNVLKHAKAKHVSLHFEFSDGRSTVILQDDGIGFDTSKIDLTQSSGLRNVTDRIKTAGGEIQVISEPGEGTTLRIRI